MASPRLLLYLFAVLLTALLSAAPASANPLVQRDAVSAVKDGSVQPQKQTDHAARRLRVSASLEEFFETDDDAEQHFKPPPILLRPVSGSTLVVQSLVVRCQAARASHRACAFYPTGPPNA